MLALVKAWRAFEKKSCPVSSTSLKELVQREYDVVRAEFTAHGLGEIPWGLLGLSSEVAPSEDVVHIPNSPEVDEV